MKKLEGIAGAALLSAIAIVAYGQERKDPVDYVSPNIGTIGQLLSATIPYAQYPHGMARIAPVTTPGITDRYLADKIYGFPAGPALLMVSTDAVGADPAAYASDFDHDFEIATPYYHAVDLQTWGIHAEFTVTGEAEYYRFTFPAGGKRQALLSLPRHGEIEVVGDRAARGSMEIDGPISRTTTTHGQTRQYFYIEFSRPIGSIRTWKQEAAAGDAKRAASAIGFVAGTPSALERTFEARVGISYISAEQAERNLKREIPEWNFDQVKANGREVWNEALRNIDTFGGTERQRVIFYTALYRSLGRMTDITEDGRYFSGYDHSVHDSDGHDFYIDDGLWDTFRSMHPLQMLVEPRRQEDMIRSYIRMYEQSGWMPSFPSVAGEQAVMIGHHAVSFILDAYAKGNADFDVEKAYAAARKNATQTTLLPWSRAPLTGLDRIYFEKGFFPALAWGEKETVPEVTAERRQAISVTLENSYDDWCLAQLAAALGKKEDAAYFTKLAHNYESLFNPTIGLMAPKSAGACQRV